MKQDLCPSRDFGPHIYENGVCAMCLAPKPKTCKLCDKPVKKNDLCQSCDDGERLWGRMDDSQPACEFCGNTMTEREATESLWQNGKIICIKCE